MPKKIHRNLEPVLRSMIENELLTIAEAGKLLGVHEETARRWCDKWGIKKQRTGPRSGDKHKGWKGGRVLISGYWHIFCPEHPNAVHNKSYMAEHRLVMERKLGRYLEKQEVVHHIDGDRLNNDPENLIVFRTNADHLKVELTGKIPNYSQEWIERRATPRKYDIPEDVREKRRKRQQWWRSVRQEAKLDEARKLLQSAHQIK